MRGMSDFEKKWNSMTVEQRAQHIVRDWQDCRESNDPLVMRVAAVVAHAVLSEAIVELNTLRAERDEARREVCKLASELPEERLVFCNAGRMPSDLAAKRGWDCFKDGKP